MLDITQIESFYPESLRPFKKNLLREYLQYKILEVIFTSPFAQHLSLMGGTAIRIIHSGTRFSEDLDFDNLGLNKSRFEEMARLINKRLGLEGYSGEIKNIFKTSSRSYIRISNILFDNKISRHRDEKLLIQLDAEPQHFVYSPERIIINKFDVFVGIRTVPVDILLAQKICCLFTRKRPMGRDFYDIIFLSAKTGPNYNYLKEKLGIDTREDLRKQILAKCKGFDFKQLSRDVAPFLFNPGDAAKILSFRDFVASARF
jgi:predicted nucleotidyltransferase component of viral defense system